MTGAASTLSHIEDYSGAESKVRRHPNVRPIRMATTIQQRLARLAPTVEPSTPTSIEELLHSAFAEASTDEVIAIAEPEVSDAEIFAAMDEAQDRAKAHLEERDDDHRNSRRYVRE